MSQICSDLHAFAWGLRLFKYPFKMSGTRMNGIYLVFESGETAHGGGRIVRVGTHNGEDNLHSRIREHFVAENKDRSIFRKNVGRAQLNMTDDPYATEWKIDRTSAAARSGFDEANRARQQELERAVSEYMRTNFSLVIVYPIDNTDLLGWESRLIATLYKCEECGPSDSWLGNYSPIKKMAL